MRKSTGIIAALVVVSALAVSAPVAHAATVVVRPAADATVFAGGRVQPSQPFLVVGGRPSARAFLRWQLPELDGVERATLELYTPTGGTRLRITTGRTRWTERSIRGRKPRASTFAGTIASARRGSWVRLDITRFAREGGSLSFVVSRAGAVATRLASREGAAAFRPRIRLLVNESPDCSDETRPATEDAALDARVSCSDDGTLTYRQTAGPGHGALTFAANGSYRYVPAANYNGNDEFGFEACDTGRPARCAGGRVRLQVAPVNDAPSAANVSLTTAEDVGGQAELKGVDVDGDALSFSLSSQASHGVASVSGNTGSYTPNANYNGADSFVYLASDGRGGSGGGVVFLTVTPVNDAPTAAPSNLVTDEDAPNSLTLAGTDVDGDALSFAIVGAASHGTVTGTPPNVTYTPAANYIGPDSFTFKARDANVDSNVATVSVTIQSVNDAPVLNNSGAPTLTSIAEDATDPAGGTITAILASGAGGDPITDVDAGALEGIAINGAQSTEGTWQFSTTGGAPWTPIGAVTNSNARLLAADATTKLRFLPNANFNGQAEFTFRAWDRTAGTNGGTASAAQNGTVYPFSAGLETVSITVTSVNDAPTTAADGKSTAEDNALTFSTSDLVGNDSAGPANEAAETLTVTSVQSPINGIVSLVGGNVTFTPTPDFNGAASFGYTIQDNGTTNGGADPKTANGVVNVTVTEVNDAPTAAADATTVLEDGSVTLPASDLLVNDAKGPPNEAGQTLTVISVQSPANGAVVLNGGGNVTFTPSSNFSGPASFTYTARDNGTTGGVADAKSATGTVNVTVTAVNDAPTAANESYSTPEDTTLDIVAPGVLVNDSDIDTPVAGLSALKVSNPSHGTVTLNLNGSFTYMPAASYTGPDSFTYKANDGALDSNMATVTLEVGSINDAPVAQGQSVTTAEDTAKAVTLAATDVDSSSLSYTLVDGPSQGALSGTAPNVTYTPGTNYNGSDSFTFKANDGALDSNIATVGITVTAVNDAPAAVDDTKNATEDTPLVFNASTLTANDSVGPANESGQLLTVTAVGGMPASQGTVVLNGGGSITYTPAPNFNGSATFDYTVRDDGLTAGVADPKTDVGAVQITVASVNDAPVLNVGGTPTLTAIAEDTTDPAGDTITSILARGAGGDPISDADAGALEGIAITSAQSINGTWQFSTNSGALWTGMGAVTNTSARLLAADASTRLRFVPNANFNGQVTFDFRAWDQTSGTNGGTASAAQNGTIHPFSAALETVSITVTAVNDAPSAAAKSVTTAEDTALSITLSGGDVDGDALSFVVEQPLHGTVTGSGATRTYTPAANYNGPDSFSFRASDGTAQSAPATVSITVTPVNDAPSAAAQSVTTAEDTARSITLSGGDVDGDALSFVVEQPLHGTVTGSGATRTYTPAANYNGPDSFSFRASDGTAQSAPATVSITVTLVNDAPVPLNAEATTPEDASVTITLQASDVEGDPIAYTVPAGSAHGTLTSLGGDRVRYTPAANFFGSDSFTFTASDGTGEANALVSLDVTPVNDAPALDASGSPQLSPVNANASDPAGDTVAGIIASGAGGDPITDVDPDDPEGIAVVAVDSTGGTWHYDPTGTSGWSTLDTAAGAAARLLPPEAKIRFVPAAGVGSLSFVQFRAWDQSSGVAGATADTAANGGTSAFSMAVETASIEINPAVNQTPTPADDNSSTNEDTPVNIDVLANDSDPDGDELTIVNVTTPDDGTAEVDVDGTVLYQPDPDTNGSDRFVYTVADGNGGTATAEVDVIVTAENDLPLARDDVERVAEDGMVVFDPTSNDVAGPLDESGGPLTLTGVTGAPGSGTASAPVTGPDAGKIVYHPNANFAGADVLQYEICDDGDPAFCSEASVDLTVSRVSATIETAPMPLTGDAADDPAIWVNPADPAQSAVIGTDKLGGIAVFDLDGTQHQYRADGRMNNVDLREGFQLGGGDVTLVTSTERNRPGASPKRIWVYKLDPATRQLTPVHRAAPIFTGFEPFGDCMYKSPESGDFYVFVVGSNGGVEQWRLFDSGGVVDAAKVREFTVPDSSPVAGDVTEACVVDDELGHLYIGEEDAGILKYSAEPDGGTTGTRVDVTGGGHLTADVEGLTIAYGPGDTGYLIASSQGNDSYAVYRREGANQFVRSFKIKQGTHDATGDTDGIDVTTTSLGPSFPHGAFVVQDGSNTLPAANQNFKLVPLEQLFETGGLGANGSCARPYADSSPWNLPINSTAAIHPDSVAHVGAITGPLRSDPSQYTYPVYVTDAGTPLETVAIEGWYSNVTNGGRTLTNQRAGTAQIPIPAGAVAAAGGDAQLVVLDPRTGDEWGLSHAEQDATGAWSAWNVYHYNTRWSAVPPYDASGKPFFPRGAGLPYLAGLVRPCELERGRIDHALAFAYDFPTGDYIYPATKSDGNSVGFPDMPEGSRLRLDPSLSAGDLSGLGCAGHCLTIARALQKYGMYIIDNSGRPKVMLEYEGTAAWGGAVRSSTVSPIPLSAFELIER